MEFSTCASSKKYIHASTKILTGHSQGILYVENPSDISFWRCIVQDIATDRYVVKPIAKGNPDGKRTLEKLYPALHKSLLVGVDSDFDYICPERHERATILNQSNFVLHTFAYSRESYECCHDAIEGLCDILYCHEKLTSQIHEALDAYSHMTYPALCIFAFLHNQDWQQHVDGLFIEAVKAPPGTCLLEDDLSINQAVLNELQAKIEQYIATYMPQINDRAVFDHFVARLRDKNIIEETAYQFINGHTLQENLIKPMLKKIINITRLQEIAYVKATHASAEQNPTKLTKIKYINKFYKHRNLETLFFSRQDYVGDTNYNQIRDKFRAVLDS